MLFFTMMLNLEPDKRSFLEMLFQTQSKRMWLLSIDILKNREQAEDAVQSAFVKLTEKVSLLMNFNSQDKVNGYVYVVTKNVALGILRKNKRHDCYSLDGKEYLLNDKSIDIEEIILTNEELSQIKNVITILKPIYKDAVYLRYYLDLEYTEIADILKISIENARVRVSVGLKKVRQELQKRGDSNK